MAIKNRATKLLSILVGSVLFSGAVFSEEIDLTGLGYVEYGDGLSYSLPVANLQYGFPTNNGPYAIPSGPGQIKDLIIVATGTNGKDMIENFAGMDNSYETPDGNENAPSSETFFYTNEVTYRGTLGTVENNYDTTWDASLASMETFLGSEQMVFFFNNNNTNSGGSADQSLAAWARVWITDASGALVGAAYEFTNNGESDCTSPNVGCDVGNPYDLVPNGGGDFLGDPTNYLANDSGVQFSDPDHFDGDNDDTDFVLSGGQICVATGGPFVIPTPVDCGLSPGDIGADSIDTINHNLGADHAAYAVLFPELNAWMGTIFAANTAGTLVGDLADYTLHVDVRLGCEGETTEEVDGPGNSGKTEWVYTGDSAASWMDCDIYNDWGTELNNGYEQIFIGRAIVGECPEDDPNCNPTVPVPSTVSIFGLGLLSLWLYRRRAVI